MSEDRQADQLIEKFSKGLTQVAGQIASAIMFFIMASAATATDPFWRRKFGERYFTPLRAILSFIGWNFALGLTIYPYVHPNEKFPRQRHLFFLTDDNYNSPSDMSSSV